MNIPKITLNVSYASIKPKLEENIRVVSKEYESEYNGGGYCFITKRRELEFSFGNLEYAHLFSNRIREMDSSLKIESVCEL